MKYGESIVLIGMPTSGKSTVGVILAKILGMDFIEDKIYCIITNQIIILRAI